MQAYVVCELQHKLSLLWAFIKAHLQVGMCACAHVFVCVCAHAYVCVRLCGCSSMCTLMQLDATVCLNVKRYKTTHQ